MRGKSWYRTSKERKKALKLFLQNLSHFEATFKVFCVCFIEYVLKVNDSKFCVFFKTMDQSIKEAFRNAALKIINGILSVIDRLY